MTVMFYLGGNNQIHKACAILFQIFGLLLGGIWFKKVNSGTG